MAQKIKDNLSALREEDLLNTVLYLIYRVSCDPKYSTISELIYILGKDQLYRLCSVLGGCEVKIPTLNELKIFTGAVYIYYSINENNLSFEEALNNLNLSQADRKHLFEVYKDIEELLNE